MYQLNTLPLFICSQSNILKEYRDILVIDVAKKSGNELSMC